MNIKTIFKSEKLRVKIYTKENIITAEANWEDPDNTEECFCRLGEDFNNLILYTIILGKIYTNDMNWCIKSDNCLTFTLCNIPYNASVTFSKEALLKEILTN